MTPPQQPVAWTRRRTSVDQSLDHTHTSGRCHYFTSRSVQRFSRSGDRWSIWSKWSKWSATVTHVRACAHPRREVGNDMDRLDQPTSADFRCIHGLPSNACPRCGRPVPVPHDEPEEDAAWTPSQPQPQPGPFIIRGWGVTPFDLRRVRPSGWVARKSGGLKTFGDVVRLGR